MPKVKFVSFDGIERVVSISDGMTVMEAAINNGVHGIDGDCGGVAACATCHVYVDAAWADRAGHTDSEHERTMVEFSSIARDTSRLACQITMTSELDGLIVHTPEAQF